MRKKNFKGRCEKRVIGKCAEVCRTYILREFVEQIKVSDTYTTDEQQKRVKIREIQIVYNFIGAFDFEGAREQSQTAQDNDNAKVGAA